VVVDDDWWLLLAKGQKGEKKLRSKCRFLRKFIKPKVFRPIFTKIPLILCKFY
jgi:hypothetical protein